MKFKSGLEIIDESAFKPQKLVCSDNCVNFLKNCMQNSNQKNNYIIVYCNKKINQLFCIVCNLTINFEQSSNEGKFKTKTMDEYYKFLFGYYYDKIFNLGNDYYEIINLIDEEIQRKYYEEIQRKYYEEMYYEVSNVSDDEVLNLSDEDMLKKKNEGNFKTKKLIHSIKIKIKFYF